jgi:hypothetical protein
MGFKRKVKCRNDEAKSVPLLRGHLSPNSILFDQILP